MSILDRLLTAPQYVLPQRTLSRFAGRVARSRRPWLKAALIEGFRRHYDVDLSEAVTSDSTDYATFADFFTRALRPDTRPIAGALGALACPADGVVSQRGDVDDGRLLQAKGRDYSLAALLAGDLALAERLRGGSFITVYLAPRNYHRVHAPCDGEITRVRYVPGRLFSVNTRTARTVDRLFARNERVVVELDTDFGVVAVVLVGAMIVGSIELTCCDVPAAAARAGTTRVPYVIDITSDDRRVVRGAELGRFTLGSTVIVATQARVDWLFGIGAARTVRMGEPLGDFTAPPVSGTTPQPHR